MTEWTSPDGSIRLINADCLTVLPTLEAGSVDAVVTDPPYGIRADAILKARSNKQHGKAAAPTKDYGDSNWDNSTPSKEVFDDIRRVSLHQVIFGGNYFTDMLPPSASWIVWDKDNGANDYADFEVAWTSHSRAMRKVRWRWHGMLQERMAAKEERVHPTQKPAGLMAWVLENYTSDGELILDPFMGSGTTGIACIRLGRRFIGIEREPKYFAIAVRRIEAELRQPRLFPAAPVETQAELFKEMA